MTPMRQAWEELAVFAEGIRIGRDDGYPGLVRVGKMTQADADQGIAIARALAEIWRAAFECRLPDPDVVGDVDDDHIVADLRVALDRVNRTLDRVPDSEIYRRQRQRLETLIDWHRRRPQGPIACVRITLAFRAMREAAERKAA